MFIIQKICNYIIFPPSIFIIILLFALYFLQRNLRKATMIIITDILLLYLFSVEPVKNMILSPLENYAAPINLKEKHNADYIVVLGGGVVDSSPEEEGKGSLSPEAMKRALHGIYIADLYKIPLIFSGGKVFSNQTESEADTAVRTMSRFTSGRIKFLKEDQSRTTYENAMYIKETFHAKKIILVTSAYHMKRSFYSFNKAGIECIAAPTDYKIDHSGYNAISFIPKSSEMNGIFTGMKEYLGLIFYFLKN